MEDKDIIDRVLNGESEAFARLVDRHKAFAFTLAFRITKNREDAEEVAQDAFLKAYRSLGEFRQEAKFSSWLYRIVFNLAISKTRRKRLPADSYDDENHEWAEPVSAAGALARISARERKHFISQAMDRLDAEDAGIVTLFYMEDAGVEEIGRITGLSESNVKVRLFRSRKKLFTLLQSMLKDEMPEFVRLAT